MKLSSDTQSMLKNFASINSNLVVKEGNTIRTIAEAKNIIAKATVSEQFDTSFGVYDLNEFLGVMSMFDDPDINISDDSAYAQIKQDRRSVKYFFSDPSILTTPAKDIQLPSSDVTFTLSQEDMNSVRKAASTLGVSDLVVTGEEGGTGLTLLVTDVKDPTSNSFNVDIDECTRPTEPFKFVFNIANFKVVNGDYHVSITKQLISHLKNTSIPLEYWIALEKNSTFGG